MAQVIKSLNLFPEDRLWRIDKKSELSHLFGGVSSVLAITIIAAVFVIKLVEVFSKNTMTVTSLSIYQKDLTTVFTTQMDNMTHKPNMLLFHNTTANIDIRVYTSPSKWIFEGEQLTLIPLQLCTEQHFSAFSGQLNYANLTQYYYNPLCLPLNQTYHLNSDNLLVMDAICKSGVTCSLLDVLTIKVIYPTTNSYEKESEPWIYDYQDIDFTFEEQSMRTINIQMNEERIVTDHGLFPFQKAEQTVSGLTATIPPRDELLVSYASFRRIILNARNVYHLHNRSFLKVLDALSYVGGIFNTLLAGFFIIKLYGKSFFEMHFAFRFFKKKEANNFGFFSFLKQSVWNVLQKTGYNIEWFKGTIREELKNTVQDMMDVVSLQHRINYLETAIKILLEPHHQKGLQLVKSKESIISQQCTKHRFRSRLISSYKKRKEKVEQDIENLSSQAWKFRRNRNREQNLSGPNKSESQTLTKHQLWMEKIFEKPMVGITNPQPTSEDLQWKIVDQTIQSDSSEQQDVASEERDVEIAKDLQLLIVEAEENLDPKSRKIVNLLDESMKEWIKKEFCLKKEEEFILKK